MIDLKHKYVITDDLGNIFVTYNDYEKASQYWKNSRARGVEVIIKTNKESEVKK